MKKAFALILLVAMLLLTLVSCEIGKPGIEDYEWEMIMIKDSSSVVASIASTADFEATQMTLVANGGKFTVTDVTNNKTYQGTYKAKYKALKDMYNVLKKSEGDVFKDADAVLELEDYEVTLDGKSGYANVSRFTDTNGCLNIEIDGYSLFFYSK